MATYTSINYFEKCIIEINNNNKMYELLCDYQNAKALHIKVSLRNLILEKKH